MINREMAVNLLYFVDKKELSSLKDLCFSVLIIWMRVPVSESVHMCL